MKKPRTGDEAGLLLSFWGDSNGEGAHHGGGLLFILCPEFGHFASALTVSWARPYPIVDLRAWFLSFSRSTGAVLLGEGSQK